MYFAREWHLINQETYLVEACLSNGLTSLRKADINRRGEFYSAFFNLSIGIERMLKVTLILDFMIKNKYECPTSKALKGFGHSLLKLINEVDNRCSQYDFEDRIALQTEGTKFKIISFLDDFAKHSRYYNLDTLSSENNSNDPLEQWKCILNNIFENDVSDAKKKRILSSANYLGNALNGMVCVIANDLEKRPINTFSAISEPQIIEAATPYAIWNLITVLQRIRNIQIKIGDMAYTDANAAEPCKIPYMSESYYFLLGDRSEHLKRKRWN